MSAAAARGARGLSLVTNVDWATYALGTEPRLRGMLPLERESGPAEKPGALGVVLRGLVGAEPDEAAERLDAYLQERILEVAGSRTISDRDSFFELGLDSLQAVALRNRLERDLGIELGSSLIFDYPTLGDLRAHLLHDHLGVARPGSQPEPVEARPLQAPSMVEGASEEIPEAELVGRLEASLLLLERELAS